MISIQAIKKRGFLRQVGEGAKKTASTLKEALLAAQSAVSGESFRRGRIFVSTSGSGQSSSFEIGVPGKEWTQDNVFGLTEELLELLENYIDAGLVTDTLETVDDTIQTLFQADSLTTVRQIGGDFTTIGWPNQMGNAGVV